MSITYDVMISNPHDAVDCMLPKPGVCTEVPNMLKAADLLYKTWMIVKTGGVPQWAGLFVPVPGHVLSIVKRHRYNADYAFVVPVVGLHHWTGGGDREYGVWVNKAELCHAEYVNLTRNLNRHEMTRRQTLFAEDLTAGGIREVRDTLKAMEKGGV